LVAQKASFNTSYIVENDKAFLEGIDRLARATSDFRIPFGLISKEFFQGNKKIFSLKGPGQYPPLGGLKPKENVRFEGETVSKRKKAETLKTREVGFAYPLLKRTGRLESSLTGGNSPEAVNVITKKALLLGTTVDYAIYHQSDESRKKIPLRKPVFISGPPLEQGKADRSSGRKQAWLNIMNQYVIDNLDRLKK